jgi:hypothetical protein
MSDDHEPCQGGKGVFGIEQKKARERSMARQSPLGAAARAVWPGERPAGGFTMRLARAKAATVKAAPRSGRSGQPRGLPAGAGQGRDIHRGQAEPLTTSPVMSPFFSGGNHLMAAGVAAA